MLLNILLLEDATKPHDKWVGRAIEIRWILRSPTEEMKLQGSGINVKKKTKDKNDIWICAMSYTQVINKYKTIELLVELCTYQMLAAKYIWYN